MVNDWQSAWYCYVCCSSCTYVYAYADEHRSGTVNIENAEWANHHNSGASFSELITRDHITSGYVNRFLHRRHRRAHFLKHAQTARQMLTQNARSNKDSAQISVHPSQGSAFLTDVITASCRADIDQHMISKHATASQHELIAEHMTNC